MLAAALLLIGAAAAVLAAGVFMDALVLVGWAIALCVVGGILLMLGVARNRPRRGAPQVPAPTWSGAAVDRDADEPAPPTGQDDEGDDAS